MGSKTTMRFAFQIVDGPNAGLGGGSWRIWTNQDDIYVASLNLADTIKASLHPSGRWRVAYTEKHMRSDRPLWAKDRDRAVWKFSAPPFEDGVQSAFVVAVARGALRPSTPGAKDAIVPVPDEWDVLSGVKLSVTQPGIPSPVSDSLVFAEPRRLANGNRVWLSAFYDHTDPQEPERVPDSQLVAMLTPDEDDVACPGFMLRGVNIDGPENTEPSSDG